MSDYDELVSELEKLIAALRRSGGSVDAGDLADGLYAIVDDVPVEDVISDLALDLNLPGA